jgi:nucleotide-binding universal stress UspA family protein
MKYTEILVPLDGSKLAEQILPYARALAEAFRIPVELLRVDEPELIPPYSSAQPAGDYLAEIGRRCFPPSAQVNCGVGPGKPAEVIVDRAGRAPGTLIAMATHGGSGVRRWLLGSVASKVVQTAKNPLLLVRPIEDVDAAKPVRLKTIYVPLDGSGLAEGVLADVKEFAGKMNLEVCLVRVYPSPPESYLVGEGLSTPALGRLREQIREEAEVYLTGKTNELQAEGLSRVCRIAIEGDAAGEIIDVARKTPDNMLAMATHGRSGLGRLVLGSVTEKVVHHSRDPVLIVRVA